MKILVSMIIGLAVYAAVAFGAVLEVHGNPVGGAVLLALGGLAIGLSVSATIHAWFR